MGGVKWNISCHVNKQRCHIYLWFWPSQMWTSDKKNWSHRSRSSVNSKLTLPGYKLSVNQDEESSKVTLMKIKCNHRSCPSVQVVRMSLSLPRPCPCHVQATHFFIRSFYTVFILLPLLCHLYSSLFPWLQQLLASVLTLVVSIFTHLTLKFKPSWRMILRGFLNWVGSWNTLLLNSLPTPA